VTVLEARPRAKLNLALGVGARRPDGFHELVSVFLRIGLADRLVAEVVEPAASGVAGGPAGGPADTLEILGAPQLVAADDLVLRAATAVRALRARRIPPLAWRLEKRIPIAAGMGGGSADAAAAVALATQAGAIELTDEERASVAASLGSDVPFFAADVAAALVGGRGEHVDPLPAPTSGLGVVLALPPVALATRDVFAAFDALREPTHRARDAAVALASALRAGITGAELADRAEGLVDANDLWVPAVGLAPELATLRATLVTATRRPWLLSGSGPTLFSLYPSLDAAVDGARTAARAVGSLPGPPRVVATDVDGPDPAWRFP
jgi:4-diphosphocytidyl-2-C-methyl-D-erythritol kinase